MSEDYSVEALEKMLQQSRDLNHQLYLGVPENTTVTSLSNAEPKDRVTEHRDNHFKKWDDNKLRYDLIPPEVDTALATVLTHGAKKYGDNNWKLCKNKERYVAALMRHFNRYRRGHHVDEDSNLPHLYHIITNVAFLIHLEQYKD